MATKSPMDAQTQRQQTDIPATSPPAQLDDTYARQFGEWIAGQVVQTAGWTDIAAGRLQQLDTNRSNLLGKLVYDAVVQFQRQGHFPVDVSMHGLGDATKAAQAGASPDIVNQHGGHLSSGNEGP